MTDALAHAIDRAAGTRPIAGNGLQHHPDSPRALQAMLDLIAGAERSVHLENYIIRDDHTGRRFGDVLVARAAAGVAVRVLYDALGSFGTGRRFWRRLRQAGAEVRAFHPVVSSRPFEILSRDHRKLLVVDGVRAMLGGLCVGDEWAGDPSRGRLPWRDTMLAVSGPAAAVLDRAFARTWSHAGSSLPAEEVVPDASAAGDAAVRVVSGVPGRARIYRAVELLVAGATERIWITDAYLIAPATLFAGLVDAARGGVDVRLLVPGTSDLPVLRSFTRIGYRELLAAGVRIFEWQGPMLHAKTMVVDRRWARIGSTNLNVSSLLTNYELDLLAEYEGLTETLAAQFRRDLASSSEIVLQPRRRMLRPRLVGAPAVPAAQMVSPVPHKRSGYELSAVAVVALRRVAGGLRRAMAWTGAAVCAVLAALLLLFPRVMSITLAAGAFWLALTFALYAVQRRRAREEGPDAA